MSDCEEIWRPIEGYEEFYEVSNLGNVRSNDRYVWNGKVYYKKKGRVLKKTKTTTGYWKVELYKNGTRKSKRVHRLVAKAFIPKVKGRNLINHKDGNPLNNRVENLEWCNQGENMQHAYNIGLIKSNFTNNKEKILDEYITNKKTNVAKLSRKYNCSSTSIRELLKKHGIRIRDSGEVRKRYDINRKELVKLFNKGLSNKEIAKRFKTNRQLIATYRYLYKKGELKIEY